eukprot:jgi/Mesvir1/7414/Mv19200-RA.2
MASCGTACAAQLGQRVIGYASPSARSFKPQSQNPRSRTSKTLPLSVSTKSSPIGSGCFGSRLLHRASQWLSHRQGLPIRASNEGGGGDAGDKDKDNSPQPGAQKENAGMGLPSPPPEKDVAKEAGKAKLLAEGLDKGVVETLRNQVFGLDTFFVTATEPYQGGTVFRGNLRRGVDPGEIYRKLCSRMEAQFGDKYSVFLLTETPKGEDQEKPIAVVLPKDDNDFGSGTLPQAPAAVLFGLITAFTVLSRNGLSLEAEDVVQSAMAALPGTVPLLLILAAHEWGHLQEAKKASFKMGLPFFLPSLDLGSFGAINRAEEIVPNRTTLVRVMGGGPSYGFAASLAVLVAGLVLTQLDVGPEITVQSTRFLDSTLVCALGKVFLGWDTLSVSTGFQVSPVALAGWSGLTLNALNMIPIGTTDGACVAHALWGRKVSSCRSPCILYEQLS